jgi:hypothetical protein
MIATPLSEVFEAVLEVCGRGEVFVDSEPGRAMAPEHDRLAFAADFALTVHRQLSDDIVREDRDVADELHAPIRRHAAVDTETVVGFPFLPELFILGAGFQASSMRVEDERRIRGETGEVLDSSVVAEVGDDGVCGSQCLRVCGVCHERGAIAEINS